LVMKPWYGGECLGKKGKLPWVFWLIGGDFVRIGF
jgi:hypothetical protein